ncbi:glycosyltransferase [Akkermansiaceae bacterium]|nr:glycosyltransferase [Akkermansiaceae bacterium]
MLRIVKRFAALSFIMKKLVQVGVDLIPSNGGIHKSTLQFSEAFNESPIISFTQLKEMPVGDNPSGAIHHFPLSKNKLLEWYGFSPSAVRRKAKTLAQQADILCCNIMLRHHACWTRSVAKREKVPYWFVTHGQLDPHVYTYRSGVKRLWLKLFGRKILEDAKFVIFSTEREREKAKWFYDGANTCVIHWPVELMDLGATSPSRTELRNRLKVLPDTRVFICLGRVHSGKRIMETIQAFSMANTAGAHLVVVGPDGDITVDECREFARQQGVGERVHLVGPAYGEEKEMYLLGADVYISLSKKENFGHTAAEGLSAGCPVVLSPGNDLSEELRAYQCGRFLDDDDLSTAATAISEMAQLTNAELELMGQLGLRFAEQKLSFSLFKDKLHRLSTESV